MGQSDIAERLLIHARLCRRMAARSLDEDLAAKLLSMADKCVVAAADSIAGESVKAAGAA